MTDKVVGVACDLEVGAPVVMLKAAGPDARALLERARQLGGVAVVKDPELVRELYRVPLDTPIGRELFPVMAALLAHVIQIDRKQAGDLVHE